MDAQLGISPDIMTTLSEVSTWISLIGVPLAIGALLDTFIIHRSKERLCDGLKNVGMAASRSWVSYMVGFIASALTGLMCIYVAGFLQKISGLGGWRKAVDSATPIALFLLIKIFVLDPALFWGTGRLRSALKGKDASGRDFPKPARLGIMCLFLLGACVFTSLLLSLGEEIQDYGLGRIFSPTAVAFNDVNPSAGNSDTQKDEVSKEKSTAELPTPKSKRDNPPTKPFSVTDILKSFNLLIADFYSHAFLFLNGATCFILLLWLLRFIGWIATHVDYEVVPRFIFTAISFLISGVLTVLLVAYHVMANK